jgi:hypothetical protein
MLHDEVQRLTGELEAANKHVEILRRQSGEPAGELSPVERLMIEWWTKHHDNTVFFNEAMRASPPLAAVMSKALK